MVKQINDIQDRLSSVEFVVYKSDTPDNRFTKIYDKLVHVEATRDKYITDNKYMRDSIDKKLNETLFEINTQVKGLE